jgi:hypothetical protein
VERCINVILKRGYFPFGVKCTFHEIESIGTETIKWSDKLKNELSTNEGLLLAIGSPYQRNLQTINP